LLLTFDHGRANVARVPALPPPPCLLQQREAIGRRIRHLRERAGLSQETLGELAGVSRWTVYRTELGTYSPRLDVLLRLARALEVPPDRLLRDE